MSDVAALGPDNAWVRKAVTILIGVASLLGAFATWHLTTVSGGAGGADGRAIQDTITQERDHSRALVFAAEDETAFARIRGYETAIASLQHLADSAGAGGNAAGAAQLRLTVQTLQQLAQELAVRFPAVAPGSPYLIKHGSGFATDRLASDLQVQSEALVNGGSGRPRPELAVASATSAHHHVRELAVVVLGFGIAIFLLALADKVRAQFDPWLAAAGTLALTAATVAAVVLW